MADKRLEHLELVKLTAEFLAKGGTIQQIPEGMRGECLPRQGPMENIDARAVNLAVQADPEEPSYPHSHEEENPAQDEISQASVEIKIPGPTGARCIICDWSPTDTRSICNPEVTEYRGNQVVIDDLTGNMLCRVCLAHAARMNSDFKIEADPNHGQSWYLLIDEARDLLRSEGYFRDHQGMMSTYDPDLGHLAEGAKKKGVRDAISS